MNQSKMEISTAAYGLLVLKRAIPVMLISTVLFLLSLTVARIAIYFAAVAICVGVIYFWTMWRSIAAGSDFRKYADMLIILSGVLLAVAQSGQMQLFSILTCLIQYYCLLFFSIFLLCILTVKKIRRISMSKYD